MDENPNQQRPEETFDPYEDEETGFYRKHEEWYQGLDYEGKSQYDRHIRQTDAAHGYAWTKSMQRHRVKDSEKNQFLSNNPDVLRAFKDGKFSPDEICEMVVASRETGGRVSLRSAQSQRPQGNQKRIDEIRAKLGQPMTENERIKTMEALATELYK